MNKYSAGLLSGDGIHISFHQNLSAAAKFELRARTHNRALKHTNKKFNVYIINTGLLTIHQVETVIYILSRQEVPPKLLQRITQSTFRINITKLRKSVI